MDTSATHRRTRRSFAVRARGPVAFAVLVSGFFVALARASEPDFLATNGSFDTDGRLQVAYSLAYSHDEGATCAASAETPVTVQIRDGGSLRAEPSTLVFESCDSHQNVIFTADSPGSHDVVADIVAGPAKDLKVSPGLLYLAVFSPSPRPAVVGTAGNDTTPPNWSCDSPQEPSQWHGDNVTLACKAWDDGSGLSLYSPAYFTLATSAAEGEESSDTDTGIQILCDVVGNCTLAGNLRGFNVDIKGPDRIRIEGPIKDNDVFYWGDVPPDTHTCTAADFGSGLASCVVEGYSPDAGSYVLQADATDKMGNSWHANLFYTVRPWTVDFDDGFSDGADRRRIEPGSTVKIPFRVYAGPSGDDERTAATIVTGLARREVSCSRGLPISGIIPLAPSSLARDETSGRFILSWLAPDRPSCHEIRIDLIDGVRRTVSIEID